MEQEYTQRIKKIEAALERWLPENIDSGWIEEVFPDPGKRFSAESIKNLLAPGKDIISRGGKRWRPLLMTLVCESLGGGDAALPLAPLVEFCHNASLIHDDIEDDSDERRGKPSVHRIYGVDTAINSGAFFYFMSLCCIESGAVENKNLVYRLWAEYMRKLHLGQAMDIDWHRAISFVPDIEDYYVMCRLKTGSLARFAAELGAYTAGAPAEAARHFGEAAEILGMGFQILDDVKNLTTGNPGKKRGDDVVEGKKSFPILLYLHRHPEKRELVFYSFYAARKNGTAAPEVDELVQTLTDTGALAEAEEKGNAFIADARKIFNAGNAGFTMDEKGRALLAGLIDLIS